MDQPEHDPAPRKEPNVPDWVHTHPHLSLVLGNVLSLNPQEEPEHDLLDDVFEADPQQPHYRFNNSALLFDQDGNLITVPSRPTPWGVIALGVSLVAGWVGFSAWATPDHPPVEFNAMGGIDTPQTYNPEPAFSDPTHSEEANYSGDAVPLDRSQPGLWLHSFPEYGQTYDQYLANASNIRTDERYILYVAPLGELSMGSRAILEEVESYLGAYYDTPTRILPTIPLPKDAYASRRDQYNARSILEDTARHVPKDALGLILMTEEDLYVPALQFLFGLGDADSRNAVFSVARYGDDRRLHGDPETVLRRSLTVAVHETGHIVSLKHCTQFRCIMNGTSSLQEADQHPLHLCPSCIRKAEHAFNFDRPHRYARLLEFYSHTPGFQPEADFIQRRLDPFHVEFVPHALPPSAHEIAHDHAHAPNIHDHESQ